MPTTDRQTVEATIIIDIPPDALWAMVSDVTRMGEWSPETESVEWLDGATGPAVGARFRGNNRRGRAKWSTTCQVTAAERGSYFAFTVGHPARPATRWDYRFEPAGEGSTKVTESFELVKPLGFFSRLVTRLTTGVSDRESDLAQAMAITLQRLKADAEAGAASNDGVINDGADHSDIRTDRSHKG